MHQAGSGTQLGKLSSSGPVFGQDPSQGPLLPIDSKLKQMKPDGQISLKLFCFQTFVFMVCCHDVEICQHVRQHRVCQKSGGELFWVEGTNPGIDCAHTLDQ